MIRRIINTRDIEPDEIFLDSSNLSGLDTQQFEGFIERPINKNVIFLTFIFFLFIISIFFLKLWNLQIRDGEIYLKRSELNSLRKIPSLPERGVIYDRNNNLLAWNSVDGRSYATSSGLYNILGYLGYPTQAEIDSGIVTDPKEMVGKEGLESYFNSILRGTDGVKVIEVDVNGEVQFESVYIEGTPGKNINLSIDKKLSHKLSEIISEISHDKGFSGGAAVILDIFTGEVLAMSNYPEYDSNVMTKRDNPESINSYMNDTRKPFLNRAISGLYSPGSVVKPIIALAALNENVISPQKEIFSSGQISIPNRFDPEKPTIFRDWKAHGLTDMKRAIAVSSDVYFYAIGGGYEDQVGLGISNIEKYCSLFGLGSKTGVEIPFEASGNVPNPKWKEDNFKGEKWILGNTYHTAIGQFGFLTTPIQMARAISAIANDGYLIKPTVIKKDTSEKHNYLKQNGTFLEIDKNKISVIKEGMRDAVVSGTAQGLFFNDFKVAAKTGTAEVGISKKFVNSWLVGFFPYDEPRYAFSIVLEKGPVENTIGGVFAMRNFFEWLLYNDSEYTN